MLEKNVNILTMSIPTKAVFSGYSAVFIWMHYFQLVFYDQNGVFIVWVVRDTGLQLFLLFYFCIVIISLF